MGGAAHVIMKVHMNDQQEADMALASLAGGVPCYKCGSICELKLKGQLYFCEACQLCWVAGRLRDGMTPDFDLRPGDTLTITVDLHVTTA